MGTKLKFVRAPSLGDRLYCLERVDIICCGLNTKSREDVAVELFENLGTRSRSDFSFEVSMIGALLKTLVISFEH